MLLSRNIAELKFDFIHFIRIRSRTRVIILRKEPIVPCSPCPPERHPNPELIRFRNELPVAQKRAEVIQAVRDNCVTLVVGETGSGKTTQIPQFILEDANQQSTPCRIFFSQPKRSLFKFIYIEMFEKGTFMLSIAVKIL